MAADGSARAVGDGDMQVYAVLRERPDQRDYLELPIEARRFTLVRESQAGLL